MAIAGWAYASHAEKALENAKKYKKEVDEAIDKMLIGKKQLIKVSNYVEKIYFETNKIYQVFNGYFDDLKAIDIYLKNGGDIEKCEYESITTTIDNGYSVAAILTDIITTPLFKPKKDEFGEIIVNEDNAVEIEIDDNGMQILNENEINEILIISKNEVKRYNN